MKPAQINEKIDNVFKALRKVGFITRKGFQCCGTCAWAQLNADEKKMSQKKKEKVKGYVFYTRQDRGNMFSTNKWDDREKFLGLYLAYDGANGTSQKQAGELVATAFRAAGLTVEWDGSPRTRILIKG